MTLALELIHLTKQFGELTAVDDLSFSLEAGTFLGLLGRNGAGKSTTLKMVTGLLKPTSGSVRVLGLELDDHIANVVAALQPIAPELGLPAAT